VSQKQQSNNQLGKNKNPIYLQAVQGERKGKQKQKSTGHSEPTTTVNQLAQKINIQFTCMLFKQKGRQKQKQNSNGSSEPTKTVEQSIQKNINPIYLQAIQVERKEETKTKIKRATVSQQQ